MRLRPQRRIARTVIVGACLLASTLMAPHRSQPPAVPTAAQVPPPVPVVMYHYIRVNPVPGDVLGFHLSVTPDHFAEQIALLHLAGWHTVSLADAMSARTLGTPLPSHPVVLTFDDGYADFATTAAPMLADEGYTATAYVVSGFIDRPGYMTLGQLQNISRQGVVIGAHTVNHLNLAGLPLATVAREVSSSRITLQGWTGQPVADFAYPYGGFNPAVERLVAASGFRDAVATCCGAVTPASDLFALPRVRADGALTLTGFAAALGIAIPAPADTGWWQNLRAAAASARHGGTVGLAPSPTRGGYALAHWDGHVTTFGDFAVTGSLNETVRHEPIVGICSTSSGAGYRLVAADGGIFSFGDAQFYGSMGGHALNQAIVGMGSTSSGAGYWEAATDGGVFSFGDAQFLGSMGGRQLNAPVVSMASNAGSGYWLAAADGGIFSFGDAQFLGSKGGHPLNAPVVAMAATPDGGGYWLVAADGGVFSFGSAQFLGSMGGQPLNQQIVDIAVTRDGDGYWLVASDGGVFAFGDAQFRGSGPREAPIKPS